MTMEQNEPQASLGQQGPTTGPASATPDTTPAASQNAQQRRRRRRRKTNRTAGTQEGQASAQPVPAEQTPDQVRQSPPEQVIERTLERNQEREQGRDVRQQVVNPAQNSNQRGRQGRNQQAHGKKQQQQPGKAFSGPSQGRQFQKGSPPQASREYNPGNGSQPQPGARRKNKVRRQAPSFVGPMDHSYRAVNGNVADGSPSTMDYRSNYSNGNGNGNVHGRNGYMDASEITAPAPLREDAPARILCFIDDLFVVAKMQETARKLGVKVSFAKAEKDTVTKILETPEADRPSLIVFDLNNANAKPLTLIPKLKAKLKRSTSVIGFLSHIQGDLKLKAMEAGCDTVMPKAAFSQNLPNLLRRHGLDEEPEMLEV